jgi:hypothetical protein
MAKKKAGQPPSPNILDYPDSMSCMKGKVLRRKQNLLPRKKLRNARSLPVIDSSQLPDLLEALL